MSETNNPTTPRSQRDEEEALVIALFRGTTAIPAVAPSSNGKTEENEPASSSSSDDHTKRRRTNSSSSAAREKVVDEEVRVNVSLLAAERRFLSSSQVTTRDVQLNEISERFKSSSMPQKQTQPTGYMNDLLSTTVQDSVNTASPTMIGHMTSSLPYYTRPLARLVTTMNQNSVKTETANTVTFLERQALAELHRVLYKNADEFYTRFTQDPSTVLGVFTSGGTIANITALWVARNKTFPGVDKVGMAEAMETYNRNVSNQNDTIRGVVVIGSELLHYSVDKALDILGIGSANLVRVPVNEEYQIRLDLCEAALQKAKAERKLVLCVIGLAGSTEAGSFDDLTSLADLCDKYGVSSFHVDAAWGGPAMFSKSLSARLKGASRAHTVTMDGHKQLYVPMGCGLLFFKDPEASSQAVKKTARYIIRNESYDLGKFTLEGSRPANAVHLHSNLHILGMRGYELLVDRSHRMACYMADRVRESEDFELLVDPPHSNILLYRAVVGHKHEAVAQLVPPELNERLDEMNVQLQERQKLRGKTFVSRTSVVSPFKRHQGARIVALRVVIANPLTYEDDIDRVLADQREILQEMMNGGGAPSASPSSSSSSSAAAATPSPGSVVKPSEVKTSEEHDDDRTSERSYWSNVWNSMNEEARAVFHGSEEAFIGSLISPDLKVEDGLMKDPRYEKHIKEDASYTYFS